MKHKPKAKMTKAEREIRTIRNKIKNKLPHMQNTIEEDQERSERNKKKRYIDTQGERDYLLEDMDAEQIFREMKRREF